MAPPQGKGAQEGGGEKTRHREVYEDRKRRLWSNGHIMKLFPARARVQSWTKEWWEGFLSGLDQENEDDWPPHVPTDTAARGYCSKDCERVCYMVVHPKWIRGAIKHFYGDQAEAYARGDTMKLLRKAVEVAGVSVKE